MPAEAGEPERLVPAASEERLRALDFTGERARSARELYRALVLAGAREEIGDQDRRHEPGEDHDFEHARHAAQRHVDRKGRERAQACDQARRDEGTVARSRQRILLRAGMDQRIDIVPQRCDQTHVPVHVRRCRRAPHFDPEIVSEAT